MFIYVDEYVKSLDTWCSPYIGNMKSKNAIDAMQECTNSPSCYMFFQKQNGGEIFRSCRNTARIKESSMSSVLYQPKGNNILICEFYHFGDIL